MNDKTWIKLQIEAYTENPKAFYINSIKSLIELFKQFLKSPSSLATKAALENGIKCTEEVLDKIDVEDIESSTSISHISEYYVIIDKTTNKLHGEIDTDIHKLKTTAAHLNDLLNKQCEENAKKNNMFYTYTIFYTVKSLQDFGIRNI